jgi:hypothetical protein
MSRAPPTDAEVDRALRVLLMHAQAGVGGDLHGVQAYLQPFRVADAEVDFVLVFDPAVQQRVRDLIEGAGVAMGPGARGVADA